MRDRNPSAWLMTDERMGNALWAALRRLPPGSGVIFRNYATPAAERRAMFRRIHRIARARRLILVAAGAQRLGAARTHGAGPNGSIPMTWPAHDRREAIRGERKGAQCCFISPVFATRSHPGAAGLGVARAARIGRGLDMAMVALGGMTDRRWRRIRAWGFDGWAAIDAFV